ncbi:DUF1203 domain-containing protein [soil metagenome]
MTELKVIAVATGLVEAMRRTMLSPGYGHPVSVQVATGHGPCRHCLEAFVVGEERRMLFTYNSFERLEAIPQPGPVFVHERSCVRYDERAGYPRGLLEFKAVLDGYDARQMLVRREVLLDGTQEDALQAMFEEDAIRYVQVRDGEAGCYDFRVERNVE